MRIDPESHALAGKVLAALGPQPASGQPDPRLERIGAIPLQARGEDTGTAAPTQLAIDPERLEKDLAKLVLTLVELLRRVMEGQAVRRMERGTLTDEEVERLGAALLAAKAKIEELKAAFGIEGEELNLDLGPLGSLL
ncbi:MAG: gas vesicle protein K [Alphaproteobacteria bacterium]